MIKKLNVRSMAQAVRIRALFQASYAVEAQLLKALDFPPLRRTLPEFLESENDFYGFLKNGELAGAVEVSPGIGITHIQSLVVHPEHFRKGIGSHLLDFALSNYQSEVFTVETGLQNGPATSLYLKFGFRETGQYNTDHGVRKVRFKKEVIPGKR